MSFDNRRRMSTLWTDQSWVRRVLPRSPLASLARRADMRRPGGPSPTPPEPAAPHRYPGDGHKKKLAIGGGVDPVEEWLAEQRRRYRYAPPDANPVAPIALAERVPLAANYSVSWAVPYMPVLLPILGHVGAGRLRFLWQRLRGTFDRFAAYRQIFAGVLSPRDDLPLPQPYHDYHEDAAFARQRLDGPNPVLIARVPDAAWLASKLPNYTAAQFQATTGRSLTAELGNLYHCDYALLQASLRPPAARDTRWRETYLPAPVVLFWYHPGALAGSDLVPVAIQVDPPGAVAWDQPDPALPAVAVPPLTVTPADGPAWALAKTLVQSADQNHQVCSTHVGRTHWVVEPVALAVPRQLPPDHPLYLLLEPHIRYTLAVNDTTIPLITEQGRIFATIYAGTLEETRQIMKETHARWSLADLALEADLQARGMDGYPGHYPYREDARRLWQATREFVAEYLGIYYTTPSQVQGDTHLQAFLTELADPARGNLRGVAASSVPQLVELVAQILFICGPQHAAVHYPQLEYFTYVPASAGAAWRPPPLRAAEVAPDRTLATLPPTHHAVVQFQTDQIGDYRYDRYGDYRRYHLGNSRDPAVRAAVDAFGLRLRQVQQEIAQDNADPAKRPRPYVYLLPDNIPNSINI